jgi:molybdopterin molybdotransferase
MLTVDEALELVLARARPKDAVIAPLADALGSVLAEEVASDMDSPPHDKSLVDGYAVLAADLASGAARLEVLEEVTAGAVPTRAVTRGKATRIMTGAPLPPGADAVVMIEYSELLATDNSSPVRVQLSPRSTSPGQNIMRRAASMARGDVVLRPGCALGPIELGVLAEVGRASARVVGRPKVAVLTTGNELVPANEVPAAGQIRNSNGPLLLAAARGAGATVVDLGIARDEAAGLATLIERGLASDVLVISGGVSAGVLDLVPAALAALSVERVFHKVSLKPGKPLWFGIRTVAGRETLVFGLPGNPASSLVCFELFVRPALARLAGRSAAAPATVPARLAIDYAHRGDRPTYHPARLSEQDGMATAEPLPWQGSADLRTLVDANALACFAAGDRAYAAGETIRAMRLPR